MKAALCGLVLLLPAMSLAETALPALHDVAAVAANDALNVRAAPDADSALLGSLSPYATAVEVMGQSPDGKWGQINLGEVAGWVAMRYLSAQNRPAWYRMQAPLHCFGTEPFWSARIVPGAEPQVVLSTVDMPDVSYDIQALWPGEDWHQVVGLDFVGQQGTGMAALRGEACSDGMSDRVFGLSIDLFLGSENDGNRGGLLGCCTIAP